MTLKNWHYLFKCVVKWKSLLAGDVNIRITLIVYTKIPLSAR